MGAHDDESPGCDDFMLGGKDDLEDDEIRCGSLLLL